MAGSWTLLLFLAMLCSTTRSQSFSTGPISLPINDLQTTTSTLLVSNLLFPLPTNTLLSLKAKIFHTFDSDLILSVTSPSGTSVILSNRLGGDCDYYFSDVTFEDFAPASISTTPCPDPTNSDHFKPAENLQRLIQENLNGVWTLTVSDAAGEDIGTLLTWGIELKGSCSSNGVVLDNACSCYSGFSGTTCSIDSSSTCGPLPNVDPLETQVIAEFMTSESKISSNTFSFAIHSPATSQRYFSSISLNKVASCSYPAATDHFSKLFLNSPGCKDVFTGNFSVSELIQDCGFTQTTEPGFTVLSGKVHVTAKDYIGTVMSNTITRTTSSALSVKLRLPTFINLTTSALEITSSSIFTLGAVTKQEYDSQTDSATIEISTSVLWPFQLSLPVLSGIANPAFTYSLQMADVICDQNAVDSECLQITTLTISNILGSSECFFNGSYVVDWTQDCRQSPCSANASNVPSLNFILAADNICAEVEVAASLSGSMKSYSDNTFSAESIVIAAGERMFFKASLASDVSIQALSVRELRVVQPTGTQVIARDNAAVAPFLSSLDFHWNEGSTSENELGFSFLAKTGRASFDLFDPSKIKGVSSFSVEVDLDITYRTTFGRKRDVATTSFSLSALGVLTTSMN